MVPILHLSSCTSWFKSAFRSGIRHAYDLKLRVDVALKSLRLDLRRKDDSVEALRREVRTAREVISPNVCRIFDLVVEEDSELISMEYIDGITLMAMLVKKGPLELKEARDIAAQFLAGLEAIHQAGLVHRDLTKSATAHQ
jgi:serine/threonine protein kinase